MSLTYSQEYLDEYLQHLGLQVNDKNRNLAQWALNAPVPSGWQEGISKDGDVYFWKDGLNNEKEIQWDHPIDDVLKKWSAVIDQDQISNQSELVMNNLQKLLEQVDHQQEQQQKDDINQIASQEFEKLKEQEKQIQFNLFQQDRIFQNQRQLWVAQQKQLAKEQFKKDQNRLKISIWNNLDVQQTNEDFKQQLLDHADEIISAEKKNLNKQLYSLRLQEEKLNQQLYSSNSKNDQQENIKQKQILLDKLYQDQMLVKVDEKTKSSIEENIIQKLFDIVSKCVTKEEIQNENTWDEDPNFQSNYNKYLG